MELAETYTLQQTIRISNMCSVLDPYIMLYRSRALLIRKYKEGTVCDIREYTETKISWKIQPDQPNDSD